MCVYIRTVQAIKRALILLKDLKKKNSYMLLIAKLNVYLFNLVVLFHAKKKREREKKNPNKLYFMCID